MRRLPRADRRYVLEEGNDNCTPQKFAQAHISRARPPLAAQGSASHRNRPHRIGASHGSRVGSWLEQAQAMSKKAAVSRERRKLSMGEPNGVGVEGLEPSRPEGTGV